MEEESASKSKQEQESASKGDNSSAPITEDTDTNKTQEKSSTESVAETSSKASKSTNEEGDKAAQISTNKEELPGNFRKNPVNQLLPGCEKFFVKLILAMSQSIHTLLKIIKMLDLKSGNFVAMDSLITSKTRNKVVVNKNCDISNHKTVIEREKRCCIYSYLLLDDLLPADDLAFMQSLCSEEEEEEESFEQLFSKFKLMKGLNHSDENNIIP